MNQGVLSAELNTKYYRRKIATDAAKRLTRLRFFTKEEASLAELKHPTALRQLKASATLASGSAEGRSASPRLGVDPPSKPRAASETRRKLSAQLRSRSAR